MPQWRHGHSALISGAAWTPLDIAGCGLWLDASQITGMSDGDAVSTWSDLSGNGNHLTQSDVNKKPVYKTNIKNGRAVVRWDGVDTLLNLAVTNMNNWSQAAHAVIMVFCPTAVAEDDMMTDGGAGTGYMLLMLYNSKMRGHAWRGANANAIDSASTITAGTWYIGGQRVTATTIELRLGGSIDAGPNALVGDATAGNAIVYLATRGAASNFDGDIGEVIVYTVAPTPAEMASLQTYLSDKWAIV